MSLSRLVLFTRTVSFILIVNLPLYQVCSSQGFSKPPFRTLILSKLVPCSITFELVAPVYSDYLISNSPFC